MGNENELTARHVIKRLRICYADDPVAPSGPADDPLDRLAWRGPNCPQLAERNEAMVSASSGMPRSSFTSASCSLCRVVSVVPYPARGQRA